MQQRVHLLQAPIDPVTSAEALKQLCGFLQEERFHHVMTPNSEMLVEASRNSAFLSVLQQSDLNLPDSVGLLHVARCKGQRIPERVTGVDTVQRLCTELSAEHGVFLLGSGPGIAERAAEALLAKNPSLQIVGTYAGSPDHAEADDIIQRINASGAQILFVAYGAPAQDMWIARYKDRMPQVRLAMGVGGTFDFLAGKAKRDPRILQTLGLEWFWRLVVEPQRFARIWTAVVVVPWRAIRS